MKIIGILGNYGHSGGNVALPEVYLMGDSSLLKDGKPFFVPDFATRFVAYPTVVARVCRLGKNIARKFASRYYDCFTVGLAVEAEGVGGALGRAALCPLDGRKGIEKLAGLFLRAYRDAAGRGHGALDAAGGIPLQCLYCSGNFNS